MTEQGKTFWVGVFILGAFLAIGSFVLFIRPSLGDGKTKMHVLFSNIEKISIGSRVTYAGKPVGEVYKIEENPQARIDPPDSEGDLYIYELILKVDSSVHVYTYDKISLSTSGLLGEKTIEITPRSTPSGYPPAKETTDELLKGDSNDRLNETMTKVMNVADTFCDFLNENKEEFHHSLQSLTQASNAICSFISHAEACELAPKTADAMEKTAHAMLTAEQFFSVCQSGTIGRLLSSDNLYLRLNAVLSQFEITLQDINRYGLLFQFSSGWNKEKRMRQNRLNAFLSHGNFVPYFHDELTRIQNSIVEISKLLDCLNNNCEIPSARVDFSSLLQQIDQIQKNLELYNEAINKQIGQ